VIEAVIFDWGGTLTPWRTMDFFAGWRAYADALHPQDAEQAEKVAAALTTADAARWGGIKQDPRAFTLAEVLADAGVPHDDDGLDAYRLFWTVATHTDPDAAPMLAELRAEGRRLGVLSSTCWPAEWHEEFLRRDGVLEYFDACVWSCELPWTKPHPEAFAAAMDAVGVSDPARCVYVGDRLFDDVSGAKAAGMRAVLVPHSEIPADQLVEVDVEPDAIIQRLAELPRVLRGLDDA
jgi:HAD superfamily hydrolase (TIGR01509 family)